MEETTGRKTPFLKKNEVVLLAVLLLAALLALLFFGVFGGGGEYRAQVTCDRTVVMMIDLREDGIYHIDAALPVTLEVKDGAVRFINSVCPDHLCEGYGFIDIPPEHAICMPALVSVQVV